MPREKSNGVTQQAITRFVCGRMDIVKTIPNPRPRNRKAKEDPHYPAAVERAKQAARRLQEAGIIDAEGRRIRKDLPLDMQEDEERDFGG
ncbi:MAG: hypothetical protein WD733_03695 [Bryobacterales bacterium]